WKPSASRERAGCSSDDPVVAMLRPSAAARSRSPCLYAAAGMGATTALRPYYAFARSIYQALSFRKKRVPVSRRTPGGNGPDHLTPPHGSALPRAVASSRITAPASGAARGRDSSLEG